MNPQHFKENGNNSESIISKGTKSELHHITCRASEREREREREGERKRERKRERERRNTLQNLSDNGLHIMRKFRLDQFETQ